MKGLKVQLCELTLDCTEFLQKKVSKLHAFGYSFHTYYHVNYCKLSLAVVLKLKAILTSYKRSLIE